MQLQNKAAIVTGAGNGLGRAIAEKLAAEGAAVMLADLDGAAAETAAAAITSVGGIAAVIRADVSDPVQVDRMVAETVNRFGRLDAMVSNAGIGGTYAFIEQPLDHWQRVLAVNLTGPLLCGQAAPIRVQIGFWFRPRFFTVLLTGFAALAIALAVVGIYVVLAFAVQQRTREIGIRMALGADGRGTLHLVLRQGMTPVLAGVAAGLLAAAGLTRVMRGILFEIRPFDPGTYGLVALAVTGVALLACWIPGHRATQVHPMEALRYE